MSNPDVDTASRTSARKPRKSVMSGSVLPSSASSRSSGVAAVPAAKSLTACVWVATRIGVKVWARVMLVTVTM